MPQWVSVRGLILKIVLATGQRPGEVCGTPRRIDLADGSWLIPSKRTKNKEAHTMPLSKLAVSYSRRLSLSGDSEFVFSSRPAKGRALGLTAQFRCNALSHAMRLNLKELGLKNNPATPHDLDGPPPRTWPGWASPIITWAGS